MAAQYTDMSHRGCVLYLQVQKPVVPIKDLHLAQVGLPQHPGRVQQGQHARHGLGGPLCRPGEAEEEPGPPRGDWGRVGVHAHGGVEPSPAGRAGISCQDTASGRICAGPSRRQGRRPGPRSRPDNIIMLVGGGVEEQVLACCREQGSGLSASMAAACRCMPEPACHHMHGMITTAQAMSFNHCSALILLIPAPHAFVAMPAMPLPLTAPDKLTSHNTAS